MSIDKNMDSKDFSQMDIFKIMKRLPHRYPFLLIDRVLDVEMPNKRLRALKNVTINEPFFLGIFRIALLCLVCCCLRLWRRLLRCC